jgi:NMD protein affecting ribosome stability and mRNA decay
MEETMKCEACGADIQDGVCTSCGLAVTPTEEAGSNIEPSEDVATEDTSGEEATA